MKIHDYDIVAIGGIIAFISAFSTGNLLFVFLGAVMLVWAGVVAGIKEKRKVSTPLKRKERWHQRKEKGPTSREKSLNTFPT